MKDLAEMAQAGSLSPQEEGELKNYRHVGRLLEIMKSRARRCAGSTATPLTRAATRSSLGIADDRARRRQV